MRKLIFVFSIVSLFLSCGNGGNMENQGNQGNKVELLDPLPVTNIHHTKETNSFTVYWDNPPEGYNSISLTLELYEGDGKTFISNDFLIGYVCEPLRGIIKTQHTIGHTITQPRKVLLTFNVNYANLVGNVKEYKAPNYAETIYWIDLP